jgi:hypothetical protein
VLIFVYRMRSWGSRIAGSDPALRKPVHGWLEFKRTPLDSYGPRMEAHLLDRQGGRDLIPPLRYAQIRRVNGVMHIVGREEGGRGSTKASSRPLAQSWLCALDPADALPLLGRVRITSITGFDPESDFSDDIDPSGL